ncbi:MAG: PTS sugar transporter subunit IIA [Candidatus Latescibacteria bacterium]|nr:PTS sugar transporter subunit IIA [Candidatus Latescibacterota bacterium]
MIHITDILTLDRVRDIQATTKTEAISELCSMLANTPEINNYEKFCTAIRARESIMSTGIGMGIAIPHSKTSSLLDLVMVVGRSRKGIDFDALDGLPVHIIILVGSSDTQGEEFLKLLAEIGRLFNNPEKKKLLLDAETPEEMYRLLIEGL